MSTEKTLATVKHGGCVKLGGSASQIDADTLWWLQDAANTLAEGGNESHAAKLHELHAALSAQPSPVDMVNPISPAPGGQEALLESLVARWRKDADEIGAGNNTLCQKIANCTMRHAAELQAALASRQPVRIYGCCAQPEGELHTAECPNMRHLAARQPVGAVPQGCDACDRTGIRQNDEGRNICCPDCDLGRACAGHAAPPAQAVDLGAVPVGWRLSKKATCYQLSHGNDIVGNLVGPDAEENAAIIARVLDSQAVGNG